MKLHLPNGLRKALLACLAALSLSTALPVTVASGTATLVFVSQQVRAEFPGPSDANYTKKDSSAVPDGQIEGDTDVTLSDSGGELTFTPKGDAKPHLKLTGTAEQEYTFTELGTFASLWLTGGGSFHLNDTANFAAPNDIYLNGAQLCIGEAPQMQSMATAAPAEAGDGINWANTTVHIGEGAGEGAVFVANDNLTAKSLEVVEDATIAFGNGMAVMQTYPDYNLEAGGKLTFTEGISGDGILTIGDSDLCGGILELTKGGSIGGITGRDASIVTAVKFGGTLEITGTGECVYFGQLIPVEDSDTNPTTLHLYGTWDVGGVTGKLPQLILEQGAKFRCDVGALSIGKLVLNGDAGIELSISEASEKLTFGTSVSEDSPIENPDGEHRLTIELDGLTSDQIGGNGYNIFGFDGELTDIEKKWLAWIKVRGTVEVEENGKKVLHSLKLNDKGMVELSPLVTWTVKKDSTELTWSNKVDDNKWDDEQTFAEGEDVILTYDCDGSGDDDATDGAKPTVTVSEAVKAGDLTIQRPENIGNASVEFVIKAEAGGTLEVDGDFTIALPTTLEMGVTVGGGIVLRSGAVLTLHEGSTIKSSDEGKRVSVGGDQSNCRVKIDLSGAEGQTYDAAGATFKDEIIVELDGYTSGNSNFRNLDVQGALDVKGGTITLQGTNAFGRRSKGVDVTPNGVTEIVFGDGHESTAFYTKETLNLGSTSLNIKEGSVSIYSIRRTFTATVSGVTMGDQTTLNMSSGKLVVTGGITGTNYNPTLGVSESDLDGRDFDPVEISLGSGDFTLGGTVTLHRANTLTFTKIGPDGGQKLVFESGTEHAGEGTLQITITGAMLNGKESGTIQLVDWGGNYGAWNTYITLNCDDTVNTGTYENLRIDATGCLVWGDAADNANALTWNVGGDDDTWGVGEAHKNWGPDKVAWTQNSGAVFDDTEGEAVTLSGTVTAGSVTVNQGTGWQFKGGELEITGEMTVKGGATLTVDTNATAATLVLQGEGTAVTFTGNHQVNMGVVNLGDGTKLILQGPQTWQGTNNWSNCAYGAGEVVFMGMGKQEVKATKDGGGILWAITNNTEEPGHDLGSLRLSTWEGGNAGQDLYTTLYVRVLMGDGDRHGLANIADIWVDEHNSLVLGAGALGERRAHHQNNTLHLGGNGSEDEYETGKTADAALMLVAEESGTGQRTIKWNISITADTSVSVTDPNGAWIFGGKMYNDGKVVEKKGEQTLILGDGYTTAASAAGGVGSGTWKVSGGTLELAYSDAAAMSAWTVELAGGTLHAAKDATVQTLTGGGALRVTGGTLILGTAEGATLTGLVLGDGDPAANLTVNAGSFAVSGNWTWGKVGSLTLKASGQTIDLTGIEQLNNASSETKLTIDLSEEFLGGNATGKGETQLFKGMKSEWMSYFQFTVNGQEAREGFYNYLKLDGKGNVTWGKAGELHWPGQGVGEGSLTLGGNATEWSEEEDGAIDQKWDSAKDVYLDADSGTYTVNVAGNAVEMASLTLAAGSAEYQFRNDSPATVTVNGDLTNGSTLTVGANITLKLYGSYSGGGKVKLGGGTLTVGNTDALNGAQLELSGGELNADSDKFPDGGADVKAKEVTVEATTTTLSGVTLTGKVRGKEGAVMTAGKAAAGLSGDISEYKGTLDTGAGGTWKLSGNALSGTVGATVNGGGTVQFAGGAEYNGKVDGSVTLEETGDGELTILSQATSADAKLKGNITLGNASTQAKWSGHEIMGGRVTLANVELAEDGITNKNGATVIVNTVEGISAQTLSIDAVEATAGVIVNVNGMKAEHLDGIIVNAHGQLKGVAGTYTAGENKELELHFTADNVSGTASDGLALIEAGRGGFTLDTSDKEHVLIDTEDTLVRILSMLHTEGGGDVYLHLLHGGEWRTDGLLLNSLKGFDILESVVRNFEVRAEGGDIRVIGTAADVYLVKGGETVDADVPGSMKAVVFEAGKSATFTTDSSATLHNLLGENGSTLNLQKGDGAAGEVTFTFVNGEEPDIDNAESYPEVDGTNVRGLDTTFRGSIHGTPGVNVEKVGAGTLTIGGSYTLEAGDTRIREGALRLRGNDNRMRNLVFAYDNDPATDEERGLLLQDGRTEIVGIMDAGSKEARVELSGGAELTLTGESTLGNTEIIGGEGRGTLNLGKGAGLTFTGDKGITGVDVEIKDAVLNLGKTQSNLRELNGNGALKNAAGGVIEVGGGTFTGTLESDGGTLAVTDKASFTLDKVKGGSMNVRLGGDSRLTVDVSENSTEDVLKLGDINLGGGRMTVDYGTNGMDSGLVEGNIAELGSGVLEFRSDGMTANSDRVETGFKVGKELQNDPDVLMQHLKFTGLGNFMKEYTPEVFRGQLVLRANDATENKFERVLPPGAGKNAHAGASMLWDSLQDVIHGKLDIDLTSDYGRLVSFLAQVIDNGTTTGLDRTFSAAAGSAISTLAPALSQDIHRQLTAIRNRTTTMASDSLTDGYDELPLWHAWLNAEGAYHKLDADGLAPGFSLHNWGGTVGVDVDISRTTTMGLAITAMYGDLEPDSADSASGDMDTYYLSAFARLAHGAWIHTLVVSGGIADVSLNRTVNYGGGSYRTDGSTDGCAFGAMYEVGYTGFVNKRGTVALQPIANVELRHVELSGYTETGSDAGVDADDMDMTVLTLGVGARVQAAVSANAFNRSTVLEGRLLVKTDIGDRSGTVENAIVKHASRAEVESAEVGAVGVEAGIGISIPIDAQSGSIFADASLEWRDNWVSTNATLGYRVNF